MGRREIIDLHCHILPGLDDGIQEIEESLQACRIAVRDGITGIVATPHYKEGFFESTPDTIRASISHLKQKLKDEDLNLQIYPGAEVHLSDNIPEKVMNGSVLSINDTKRYILLELPYQQYPVDFERFVFSLKLSGMTPVLAHPERVAFFKDDIGRIEEAVRLGALTQITSSSVTGVFGEEAKNICIDLATKGLVHIIASDSHDASHRPPCLMDACTVIAEIVGEEEALRMISDTPLAIVSGREIIERKAQPIDKEKRREGFFFRKLFSRKS